MRRIQLSAVVKCVAWASRWLVEAASDAAEGEAQESRLENSFQVSNSHSNGLMLLDEAYVPLTLLKRQSIL